ncbi:MAG: hypothetical protein V3T56_09505, partial [Gemmatimonadales bacterium]
MGRIRTLRGRLAVGYAIALATTMFVFAATVYFVQRPDPFSQLDTQTQSSANLIAAILIDAYDRGFGLVVGLDTLQVAGETTTRPVLAPRVAALLQSVEDYVVILDSEGDVLFASEAARPSVP